MSHDTRPSGPEQEAQLAAWEQAVLKEDSYGTKQRVYVASVVSALDQRIALQATISTSDFSRPDVRIPLIGMDTLDTLQRDFSAGHRYIPSTLNVEPWTIDTFSKERTTRIQGVVNQHACGLSSSTEATTFLREHFGLEYGTNQGGLAVSFNSAFDNRNRFSLEATIGGAFGIPGVKGHGAAAILSFTEQARNRFPRMRITPLPVSEWIPQVTSLLVPSTKNTT